MFYAFLFIIRTEQIEKSKQMTKNLRAGTEFEQTETKEFHKSSPCNSQPVNVFKGRCRGHQHQR